MSAGQLLRDAMAAERPLQIVGTINAYTALLAQDSGYRAIYLSGGGVANASYGLPDLALTSLNDVVEDVRRIAGTTEVPLLVDADTGWGPALMIARTVRELTRAGAAGCHIEDQVQMKRCGHRPGKALVSGDEMADRIKSAVGQDGCAGSGRPGGGHRKVVALCGSGGRRHLRGSGDRAGGIQPIRGECGRPDPREHYRIRKDAAVYDGRIGECGGPVRTLSVVGVPGDEQSGTGGLPDDSSERDASWAVGHDANPCGTV